MLDRLKAWLDTLSFLKCNLYEQTGLYCPGCGGTRAVLSLLKGDIIGSLKYNPIVLYSMLAILIYFILKFKKKLTIKGETNYIIVAIIVGIVIATIRTIIIDYIVVKYGIHVF